MSEESSILRSFGGGPLLGNNLVRLIYMDEAGISNPVQEPFLVVAGLIVHADKALVAVERAIDKIVKRHIPEEHWEGFVFHASQLFNGGGKVFDRDNPDYPLAKRLEIAEEIAIIPKRHSLPIALGYVERRKFFDGSALPEDLSPREAVIAQHATAFMVCALTVEYWMRRNTDNEVCMLIVEDNQQARKFIKETQQYNQRLNVADRPDDKLARALLPLRKIREDPAFQDKRPRSVLQLADFCAYVCKRNLMGDRRYDRFHAHLHPLMIYPNQAWVERQS